LSVGFRLYAKEAIGGFFHRGGIPEYGGAFSTGLRHREHESASEYSP